MTRQSALLTGLILMGCTTPGRRRLARACVPKLARFPGAGRGPVDDGFWHFFGSCRDSTASEQDSQQHLPTGPRPAPGKRTGRKVPRAIVEWPVPEKRRRQIAARGSTSAVTLFRTAVHERGNDEGFEGCVAFQNLTVPRRKLRKSNHGYHGRPAHHAPTNPCPFSSSP